MLPIKANVKNSMVYRIVKLKKSDVILPTILMSGPIYSLNWKMVNILRIKHTIQTAKMYENGNSILAEKLATSLILDSTSSFTAVSFWILS